MGDVIQVTDKMFNMPLFDIVYRKGSLLNLYNEMTTEQVGGSELTRHSTQYLNVKLNITETKLIATNPSISMYERQFCKR